MASEEKLLNKYFKPKVWILGKLPKEVSKKVLRKEILENYTLEATFKNSNFQ